jgi:exodeoxyribonuclease V alpha subunit
MAHAKVSGYVQGRMEARERLRGIVEEIRFYNPENGYTVLRLTPEGGGERCWVVGRIPDVAEGQMYELHGARTQHPKYGPRFQAETAIQVAPSTQEGIRKYLGSGLIPGLGPRLADRIVDAFGTDTFKVFDEEPARLLLIPDLGRKKLDAILSVWGGQALVRDVMSFLRGHRIDGADAVRVYKHFGDETLRVAQGQPYRLTAVRGIGFVKADALARSLGFGLDHPERLKAGIEYVLAETESRWGHTFQPRAELAAKAVSILGVPTAAVEVAIEEQLARRALEAEPGLCADTAIYRSAMHAAELGVARHLVRLATARGGRVRPLNAHEMGELFEDLAAGEGLSISDAQRHAVVIALRQKVCVLTGGPGVGKTVSMRAVVRGLQAARAGFVLAAPTGRAARRLADATGASASTIHRLLRLLPGEQEPRHDERNPLDADMVIVDETSMVDIKLLETLLRAVPDGAHMLFVGDADQLPSVGPGNALADIIESGVVPVVRLETIFRQDEGSAIVENAHRINGGRMPVCGDRRDPANRITDFYFLQLDTPERKRRVAAAGVPADQHSQVIEGETADQVIEIVTRQLPRLGFSPGQIQVLTPMRTRGVCSVTSLNARLQATLNPPAPGKPERRLGGAVFRPGDRVMHVVNDYEKGVFNGDTGVVRHVLAREGILVVALEDGREVSYQGAEIEDLELAYALTIHKAQGAEYRAVVVPLANSQWALLERRLIYTAVTRARELVVLVGSHQALRMAVEDKGARPPCAGGRARYTGLAQYLRRVHTREREASSHFVRGCCTHLVTPSCRKPHRSKPRGHGR